MNNSEFEKAKKKLWSMKCFMSQGFVDINTITNEEVLQYIKQKSVMLDETLYLEKDISKSIEQVNSRDS